MGGDSENGPPYRGTGPSCRRNSLLREAQGRALIIAVGQPSCSACIRRSPHSICSIDFGESIYLRVDANDKAVMPSDHPQGISENSIDYQGGCAVTWFSTLLTPTEVLSPPPRQRHDGAQTARILALAVGADPIVFTGQDLAYGESSHVEGAKGGKRVTVQGSRIIMKNERVTKNQEVYWVPGYFGGRVPTNSGLLAFREDIEETIRHNSGRRFINATEGGAHIAVRSECPADVLKLTAIRNSPSRVPAGGTKPLVTDSAPALPDLETSRKHVDRLLQRSKRNGRR